MIFAFIKQNILAPSAFALVGFLTFTALAHAQATYSPLVGIPGLTDLGQGTTIPQYINAVYLIIISLGGLYGVIKISIAGVKYSLSDVITDKSSAIHDIQGVLLGLAILLIPFIVLNTIYPNLTNLDVLRHAGKVDLKTGGINYSTVPNQSDAETRRLQRLTPQGMCLEESGSWMQNTCCPAVLNTAECLAKITYVSNPSNTPVTDGQWQFTGKTFDECSAIAKERSADRVFRQTSLRLGTCDIYPKL